MNIQGVKYAWGNDALAISIEKMSVARGERLFLKGPSGSGKSTLLGLIAGVFEPSAGEITVLDLPFHQLRAPARDQARADSIGVIFQQFNLVPYLTLVENVLLPYQFSTARAARVGATDSARQEQAVKLLTRLGLGDEARANRTAAELSVGQQQRVAAARALLGSPPLIIADEPTSALDAETRDQFIATLLHEASDAAVLFVSHDASLATHFDRVADLRELNAAALDRVAEA